MVLPISTIVEGAKSLVTPFIQPLFVPFLYWTLTSLGTIISVWTNGDRIQDENEFLNPVSTNPYDFIIVGAGSAGCLLANRLSRNYNVLLLEAGGEPNPLQFIPGFSLFFANYPELDWQHRTVPQRYASLTSVNQESSWSTGIGLGGTGNLNYMIHLRGHKRDFDNWGTILNDPSWSWNGVLPFFKSYENYEIPGDPVNHGYNGDLRIEEADLPRTARDFVRAGVELGYPNVDLNAPFNEGFDILRYPILRGVRQAPYKAFLEPVRFRNNLQVIKFSQVNKILIRNGNIAYGVQYDRHGRTYVAHARREVIVSAGTVGSPKLLMLSGIGPSHHLSQLNIPVVADLPVGENLQDHLSVYLLPFFIRSGLGYYLDRDLTIGQFVKWFTLGRGRLTSTGCEATGIFSSSFAKERGEGNWPDIQVFSYGLTYFRDGANQVSRVFNLKLDEIYRYLRNDVGRDSLYLVVSGARPFSRGYIKLGGNSPYDNPIIDPNYLGDPGGVDLKVLLEAVKKTVYLMENTTTGGVILGARFTTTRLPGCEHLEFRSDEYWICFIRRYSVTLHHPVGTCSLGTVVDTQLRVVGVRGLRVIDASVQPVLVTTNTQASTLMIAEKGADMILKYWRGLDQGKKGLVGSKGSFWGGFDVKRNVAFEGNGNYSDYFPPAGIPQKYTGRGRGVYGGVEESMKEKLEKSLQDLKLVSELARENYNKQFENNKGTSVRDRYNSLTTSRPVTSTRETFRSTTTPKWGNQNDVDYYDDYEDDGSTGQQQDFQDYKLKTRLNPEIGKDEGVPRPASPPKPPAASAVGGRGNENGVGDYVKFRGTNNPSSLDDIEQFYEGDNGNNRFSRNLQQQQWPQSTQSFDNYR